MCLISIEKWLNILMNQTIDQGQRVKAERPRFSPSPVLFFATLNLKQQKPQGQPKGNQSER